MIPNINNISTSRISPTPQISRIAELLKTNNVSKSMSLDSLTLGESEFDYATYSDKPESTHPLAKLYNGLSENEVFDKLREMKVAAENADYSGMSDVEIYQSIYDRYAETFGENFGDGNALMIADGAYGSVWACFRTEVQAQFGSEAGLKAVNKQRLYGDMSTGEIQDTIRAKYPANLSNRDMCLMTREMLDVGCADDGMFWMVMEYRRSNSSELGVWTDKAQMDWESKLDMPFSVPHLMNSFNEYKVSNNKNANKSVEDLIAKLFDVNTNSDGYYAFDINLLFKK